MKINFPKCDTTTCLVITLVVIFLIIYLIYHKKYETETFKIIGGNPNCPYRDDESCPYLNKGTGPGCQIDKDKVGCPACCGNIDWYLGAKKYNEKCKDKMPPAFTDMKDYYASIQEGFMAEKNITY